MRGLLDVEGERRGHAGRQGLRELVAAQAQGLVVFDQLRRHADLQSMHVELLGQEELQVQRRHRRGGLVLQHVAAACARTLLARVQRHVELHLGDLGLRLGRQQRLVLALVVGLVLLPVVRRLVVVQQVGVVEDEAAERDEACQAHGAQGQYRPRQSRVGAAPALAPAGYRAACPHQVRDDEQHQRGRGPVGLEGPHARQEVAPAVHVGVDRVRHRAELVQVVLQPQRAAEAHHDVVDDHHEVAHVLVVHDAVHRDRQCAQQPVAGQVDDEQRLQVHGNVEAREALRQLDGHAAQHQHRLQQRRDKHQRDQLGHERQPGRRRQRIGDLVQPRLALAPHQLAGIERDDDQHEQAEGAAQQSDDLEGVRPGARAEDVAQRRAGEDQEQDAGEHQHAEVDVLDGLAEVEGDEVGEEAQRMRCANDPFGLRSDPS